ncbi:MAG: aminotransferase class III-fold pyridoxal phosphate-dependent enzyme, partial [Candidatus Methanofastidiosa archaeon]|nr:aminotransferase class III-fold pyridoxal phosphate-dependent enzyme [Candidatus Methanofastidiosa archaeon]
KIGNYFISELEQLAKSYNIIKEVRGRGLMIALELNDNYHNSPAAPIQKELLYKGFIVAHRPGFNVLRIDPPLTIGKEDIESFINSLKQILKSY